MENKEIANKLNEIIVRDQNIIVGEPIITQKNTEIIPISRLIRLNVETAGEFGKVQTIDAKAQFPYANGRSEFTALKPIAFIIEDENCCRLINLQTSDIDNILNRFYELLNIIIKRSNC